MIPALLNPATIALINLVAKVGLDTAITIVENLNKATTTAEALTALKAARDKTAADYLAEAKAGQAH